MERQGRIEKKPGENNNQIVLVPYMERIKESHNRWLALGLDPNVEKFKLENEPKVSQWYRLTLDLRALNRRTKFKRFPLPRIDDSLANRKSGLDSGGCDGCLLHGGVHGIILEMVGIHDSRWPLPDEGDATGLSECSVF
jgi:hypothetical protein